MGNLVKNKRKPNRVDSLEFRVEQIEMALMNLMFVVSNPDKELDRFKKNMEKAESVAENDGKLFSMIIDEEGAEACMLRNTRS